MLLEAKSLLTELDQELQTLRQRWSRNPGLALVWVGDDAQTAAFIRAKQRKAKELDCNFFLHHFPAITNRQLEAVISSLNQRQDIDGIVLQLPLPVSINTDQVISLIAPQKDIDGLRGDFPAPTPSGILALLKHNQVSLVNADVVILGDGRLVGRPLSHMLKAQGVSYTQLTEQAEQQKNRLRQADIIITATGRSQLLKADMVAENAVVVDGSGIDVDYDNVAKRVKLISPKTGGVGPLTVAYLFKNLLSLATK
jgi:methylenetetrahydrofolate dehydrogenase (NADP+)/methenyltetrahydrofolate cyclohydrolase